jgi:hypothetical protein
MRDKQKLQLNVSGALNCGDKVENLHPLSAAETHAFPQMAQSDDSDVFTEHQPDDTVHGK